MRERADVADRRAELAVTCDVLARALAQLQQIPRELESTGGRPSLPGDAIAAGFVRRSQNLDMYAGRPR